MTNPLVLKLGYGSDLRDEDRATLETISTHARRVGPRLDLISEGDRPENVHLVLDGVACRYKMLPDGRRAIMALLLPGDFCDLHVALLGEMDHSIATITACTVVGIPRTVILDLTENHPRITRALWWATLVDEGVLREWLVGIGKREADQRTAHLLCELLVRLRAVGRADADGYDMPLTQAELGEVLGLSTVHVNRTLQTLREAGLIVLKAGRMTIPDVARLEDFAHFTPNYLHLTKRSDR